MSAVLLVLLALACAMPASSQASEASRTSEPRAFTVSFESYADGEYKTVDAVIDDDWFDASAETYNHDLARLSVCMAVSAFRPTFHAEQAVDPSENLQLFLTEAGFTDLRCDDYDKTPTLYTVATAMGRRQMVDEKGPYTLIACGVCGGGYQNEWLSNFTVGDGVRHKGFADSALHVEDRIFGYIAQSGTTGRVKLWISGFSRGAAISNIVAADMVDYGVIARDDIFAYTFATPRTTTDPKPGSYPNIFNIVGKMDLVPQVPLGDWGFARYGTDMQTLAQETDSGYADSQKAANDVYHQVIGADFWNNVELNAQLKTVLGYILKLSPTKDVYVGHLQDRIIQMYGERDALSLITNIIAMSRDPALITPDNVDEASALLDFVTAMAVEAVTRSGASSASWYSSASIGANLLHEHNPDVYLAWLYSSDDPADIYSDFDTYSRIVVQGDVSLVLYTGESLEFVQSMDASGNISRELRDFERELEIEASQDHPDVFMLRAGDRSICVLPEDRQYDLKIESNADQAVSMYLVDYSTGRVSGEVSNMVSVDMERGEFQYAVDLIKAPEFTSLSSIPLEYYYPAYRSQELVYSPGLLTRLENINVFSLSWLQMLIIGLAVMLLFLAGLIVISALLIRRHGRTLDRLDADKRPTPAPNSKAHLLTAAIVLVVACFALSELAAYRFGVTNPLRLFFKVAATAVIALVGIVSTLRTRWLRDALVCVGLVLCAVGDFLINTSALAGILAFGAGHVAFCLAFLIDEPPGRIQVAAWAAAALIAVAAGLQLQSSLGSLTIPVIAYACLLLAMLVFGWRQPPIVRLAIVVFIISDAMTAYLTLMGQSPLRTLELGLYYLAVFLFAYEIWRRSFGMAASADRRAALADEGGADGLPA